MGLTCDTYSYDSSGNMLTFFNEDWDSWDEKWKNDYRITYTYDSSGNRLTEFGENWSSYTGSWETGWRGTFNYNTGGDLIYLYFEHWSGWDWYTSSGNCSFMNNDYYYSYNCSELSAYYSLPTTIRNAENKLISIYSLSQNYPNPFNPMTAISYKIFQNTNIKLVIYNSLGQEIANIVDKEHFPGNYDVKFDGTGLSSGVYFYRIISDSFVETKKMILIR